MMQKCPCGLNANYLECCGQYHTHQAIAETPETLMRSRYSAYALGDMNYIKETMQGQALVNFNESESLKWSKSVVWLGLRVINANEHTVEFSAQYLEKNSIKTIHEVSEFKQINHSWFYIAGNHISEPTIKIPRNSPCPCGSKKKFKNCHEK